MYRRYKNNEILKTENGVRFYSTKLNISPSPDSTDIYVRTQDGDRLDLLAYRFYNDVSLWYIIANANNVGKGTLYLESGIQLRIPNKSKINNLI